jgi:curved DNA-binding protein CbpA
VKNHYDVIGVPVNATQAQITAAYRIRSKMLHPDRFDAQKQRTEWELANEMIKELNLAYSTLRDPSARTAYDRVTFGSTSVPQPPKVDPAATSATADNKTRAQSEPPPPRRAWFPPLEPGTAYFSDLPPHVKTRLRQRYKGVISQQFRTPLKRIAIMWLLAGATLIGCIIAAASFAQQKQTLDINSIASLAAMWAGIPFFVSLFQIHRWYASPLKRMLFVTPSTL